jgi:hypothetical protein
LGSQAGDDLGSFHLAPKGILPHEEGSSPVVKEFASPSFSHVGINDVGSFAVFIHGVECISVPDSDVVSLSVIVVVAYDFNHLSKSVLELPGDL